MRGLTLYLRSRGTPMALALAGGCAALMWSLWSVFSDSPTVGPVMVILTVLLLVAAVTATLGGPDDALDATAGLRWPRRRVTHLLAAFLVVVVLLLVTAATGARFGPAGLVVRDAAGLLGLTALGAATMGTARAWFMPLGWTLAAVLFPRAEPLLGRVLTWPAQPPASTAAAVTAGLLAAGGLVAYAMAGPAQRPPAEAAQQ
ncbi:hypothetical protein GCM10020358_00390 [Amorphoplanes nipponensis]|uniref:Uncharacterized protein n=1 Tax=Actinoplanes nipponensis TaxID=135950 RepID=A0A919MNE0_9ACTN|nr:hypothetical protein [Actinoplanes nipponensis]GIE51486.1 hypothetical protein Ani05nite_50200 [Actinoplanes nipponensis]